MCVANLVEDPSDAECERKYKNRLWENISSKDNTDDEISHPFCVVVQAAVGAVIPADVTILIQNNCRRTHAQRLVDVHVGAEVPSLTRHETCLVDHGVQIQEEVMRQKMMAAQ